MVCEGLDRPGAGKLNPYSRTILLCLKTFHNFQLEKGKTRDVLKSSVEQLRKQADTVTGEHVCPQRPTWPPGLCTQPSRCLLLTVCRQDLVRKKRLDKRKLLLFLQVGENRFFQGVLQVSSYSFRKALFPPPFFFFFK